MSDKIVRFELENRTLLLNLADIRIVEQSGSEIDIVFDDGKMHYVECYNLEEAENLEKEIWEHLKSAQEYQEWEYKFDNRDFSDFEVGSETIEIPCPNGGDSYTIPKRFEEITKKHLKTKNLFSTGGAIEAIKDLRQEYTIGFKDAKNIVSAIASENG